MKWPALGTPTPAPVNQPSGKAVANKNGASANKASASANKNGASAKKPAPAPATSRRGPLAPRGSSALSASIERTPAPLPPPPTDMIPTRALVVSESSPSFREATSMWFREGEEQAARALRDAEADALERASESVLGFGVNRTYLIAGGAAFALVVALILALS